MSLFLVDKRKVEHLLSVAEAGAAQHRLSPCCDGDTDRPVPWMVWWWGKLVGLEVGFFCLFLICFLNTDVDSKKCNVGNSYIYSETLFT